MKRNLFDEIAEGFDALAKQQLAIEPGRWTSVEPA